MSQFTNDKLDEQHERLWLLFASPTIWAVHFLATYVTAAIWCAKVATSSASLGPVRVAVGCYTLAALAGIGLTGWCGFRRVSFQPDDMPHDDDTPHDRHRFIGFATLLLSTLSAVATLFVAAVFLFVKTCD